MISIDALLAGKERELRTEDDWIAAGFASEENASAANDDDVGERDECDEMREVVSVREMSTMIAVAVVSAMIVVRVVRTINTVKMKILMTLSTLKGLMSLQMNLSTHFEGPTKVTPLKICGGTRGWRIYKMILTSDDEMIAIIGKIDGVKLGSSAAYCRQILST